MVKVASPRTLFLIGKARRRVSEVGGKVVRPLPCVVIKRYAMCDLVMGMGVAFTGVSYDKLFPSRPWRATLWVGGKSKYLGSFKTEEEAAAVYQKAKTNCDKTMKINRKSLKPQGRAVEVIAMR